MRLYLSVQTCIVYTYRSIIDQRYIHHGRKHTILDFVRSIEILYLLEEGLIEGLGFEAACGLVKIGLVALLYRGKKGEL